MGQLLHGSAKTTEATRRAIQNSQESLRTLASRYSINPKTVAKWRKRNTVKDAPMGPKTAASTVLTDNGIQFADLPKYRNGITAQFRGHPFDRVCRQNGIEHRLTKPNHPWTNGQVERMNRTLKEATVNRYYYQSHEELEAHLDAFVSAYNFAKRLKTLKGLPPYEFIVNKWAENPQLFHHDPAHLKLGLYT
jgi:Transposase and inactivated derivatives